MKHVWVIFILTYTHGMVLAALVNLVGHCLLITCPTAIPVGKIKSSVIIWRTQVRITLYRITERNLNE